MNTNTIASAAVPYDRSVLYSGRSEINLQVPTNDQEYSSLMETTYEVAARNGRPPRQAWIQRWEFGGVLYHFGRKSLRAAELFMEHNGHTILFKRIISYTYADGLAERHMFASATDFAAYFQILKSTPDKDRTFQPIILDSPVKLYLDVEWYGLECEADPFQRVSTLIDAIYALFQELKKGGVQGLDREDCHAVSNHRIVTKCSQQFYKYSFHVIMDPVFENNHTAARLFVQILAHQLRAEDSVHFKEPKAVDENGQIVYNDRAPIIDLNVYHRNQPMRDLDCRKPGQTPMQLIMIRGNRVEKASSDLTQSDFAACCIAQPGADEEIIITEAQVRKLASKCGMPLIELKTRHKRPGTQLGPAVHRQQKRARTGDEAAGYMEQIAYICEHLVTLLRNGGDTTSTLTAPTTYKDMGLFPGRNNGPRLCLIGGEMVQNNNCWMSINPAGKITYGCHSARAHKAGERKDMGELPKRFLSLWFALKARTPSTYIPLPPYTEPDVERMIIDVTRRDVGHANIFCAAMKGRIVILDAKECTGIAWNPEQRLWISVCRPDLVHAIPLVLESQLSSALFADPGKKDAAKYLECICSNVTKSTLSDEAKSVVRKAIYATLDTLDSKKSSHVLTTSYARAVLAQAIPTLSDPEFAQDLNRTPHLLPVQGGLVVDLRTLDVRQRVRTDMFSFECPVTLLDHRCDCNLCGTGVSADDCKFPAARRFFCDIMGGDLEMVGYLQKLFGYFLTGEIRERHFYVLVGAGNNGKGVLCNLVRKILGPTFYAALSKDVMVLNNKAASVGAHTAHLMPLASARLGVVSETSADDRLNAALVKEVTGNDPLSVRPAYGKQTEIVSQCKVLAQTNNKIQFDAGDLAVVKRFREVVMPVRFEAHPNAHDHRQSDPEFVQSLFDENLNEVFSFIAHGARNWYATGPLKMPEAAQLATRARVEESDSVQQFIDEECNTHGDERNTAPKTLYERFRMWAGEEKEKSSTAFTNDLERRCFEKKKSGSKRWWQHKFTGDTIVLKPLE